MPPEDVVERVKRIAAQARATDPRLAVVENAPDLVAWLKEWQTATGSKANLTRAWWPGGEYRG